ncbi:ubiquitin carboxyl-terminal hydrolase CYLD isoform X2 [Takifugu rubripes]|uniref:ubiquitinyl hydrolase 1 n=1 Tax=Takifugu rubripes TaxID=31033 RepID=A0A3B5KBJ3_TAKRU|nr:ubiquitin carboxyl-terminal hydrolase CYLD-like isoform X2 [Takifugu rubripes]
MEAKTPANDKYFIVIRGKSRKGFCRGCIGRVETETPHGEIMGLLYATGSPKSGGIVAREDTYPLTRHQAQLLLFISNIGRRLELLCNPQLFSAICALALDDLVVVKHRKGPLPGVVRNLMQVGRKESKDDLHMLGFEVEFMDFDSTLSSKKPAPLLLFSAADIVQVVPSYSPVGLHWRDGRSESPNKRAVTRINSMPNLGSNTLQRGNHTEEGVIQGSSVSQVPLEVGSIVEVESTTGIRLYGVVRWLGVLKGKRNVWAGIELDYEINGCSDGTCAGQRYFSCKGNRALFVPANKCSPDSRLGCYEEPAPTSPVPPFEDSAEDAPPIPESEALSLLVGRMKGIQGHVNSCYLDATLFSLFSSSLTLDNICRKPADTEKPTACTLRKIVNRLRRQGFVPADSVALFRRQLGCDTFRTEEKDPEEFITLLFQKVFSVEPLLKLRSAEGTSQGTYTFQIFLEKEQMGAMPTVQQLLDTSCLSGDLKFEEVPSCLMVQMPRFGNKYKMFSHIIPSTELDITDLLCHSQRECFICGRSAEHECLQCLPDRKLQPGRIKQYCSICNSQVHKHPCRQGHDPKVLTAAASRAADGPVSRSTMELFAVLCIHTSHYVCFVKYGPGPRSWIFFDSMADRCGDDQNGYNIPEIRACPEVGEFLSRPEEELARTDPGQTPDLVRRLLCDSYMFLYQNPTES